MCIMCNLAFVEAFRNFLFPSRRQILKSAAAMTTSAMVCETIGPGVALAETALFPRYARLTRPEKVAAGHNIPSEGDHYP
jgi:hypothetical protein